MLIILDCNGIAYRAYHKAPPLTAPDGTPTGAVHIFFIILEKVRAQLNPSQIFAVFDAKGETTRHKKYPQYKATREAMPEDLAVQIETIRSLLPLAGIPVYMKQGIEADDIIATLARIAEEPVVIVTKDKDLFQLINDNIKIYDDHTGTLLGSAETKTKYGVLPEQMQSYLSLLGDKSDNIPGITGVGEKTAAKLIQEYGSLDNIYAHADEIKGKVKEYLERDKENAYLAMELIKLEMIEPLFEPVIAKDIGKLRPELEKLGLRTVAAKLFSSYDGAFSQKSEETNVASVTFSPCLFGKVNNPTHFIAVKPSENSDGWLWVTDGNCFEPFRTEAHLIKKDSAFYDVKTFSRIAGNFYPGARDYLLISWLCEPDSGGLQKGRLEPLEEFIPRFLNAVPDLDRKLKKLNLEKLHKELEIPVAYILGSAEQTGIRISPARVSDTANVLKQKVAEVASRLITRSNCGINLNSPKQLSEYIYDKLGISPVSKNNRSTAEDVLRELINKSPAHKEIIEDILTYREYSKLLSTYTSPLADAVAADGRIHTTFKQTGASTGRLSSVNPNLQNIPVRGEIGKTIRTAFIPDDGYCFVSLDYSQIELRILAHFSSDPTLTEAFHKEEDVHTITAMKIFNKNREDVTPNIRRLAKAVNFGIIYGLSPFGLSRDTGITPKEAKDFIDIYFTLYKNVRGYILNVIESTRDKGYCETILGRKRFFPDINSRNGLTRQKAERAAMNAPIQGSAADIIKVAMIKCDKLIKDNSIDARLCLQIHDELIFEVRLEAAGTFLPLARKEMESAVGLNVPLVVNTSSGADWGELK
ncbi:MAG: DNA polymerase I [Deferribacteraceae bacterium]|jgi:DNA polymerase-1|nr:DNA polymerase I [Deferribacteraceae bacterium]